LQFGTYTPFPSALNMFGIQVKKTNVMRLWNLKSKKRKENTWHYFHSGRSNIQKEKVHHWLLIGVNYILDGARSHS
jgi:hypothetical protein